MSFRVRFLLLTVLVPLVAAFFVAVVFVAQVIPLDRSEWIRLIAAGGVSFGLPMLWLGSRISRCHGAIEKAKTPESMSDALSRCLQVTSDGSNVAWLAGAMLFTALTTAFVLPSVTGFSCFGAAAILVSTLAIIFAYGAAKRLLAMLASHQQGVSYTGSPLHVGRKLGVVFIGLFIASTGALVQLVTARVSLQLERIALAAADRDFQGTVSIAKSAATLPDEDLRLLDSYLASRYVWYRIDPDGKVTSSQPRNPEMLTADEVRRVRALRQGNSASFVAPHVMHFASLPGGAVLVMSVPWTHFQSVPKEITFYALVIAGLTVMIFVAATYFLAADITRPLRRVRQLANDMAVGKFGNEASIFTDDEIGDLAKSFTTTRLQLRSLIAEAGTNGTAVSHGVRVISSGSVAMLQAARKQSQLTTDSTTQLLRIRTGAGASLDAAEKVAERASSASTGAAHLTDTARSIGGAMDQLAESVEQIASSATEMGATAREMSSRTSGLASASEDVVSFVAQMDATIEELRTTAGGTAALSRQVDANATTGSEAVAHTLAGVERAQQTSREAADVMRELDAGAQQINLMLDLIEQIASRTNLLSLNAAIIAAQAGEQGSGFGVVASEVRTLAEETRRSTKDIAGIVGAIQKNARSAVMAIDRSVEQSDESVSLAKRATLALETIQQSATASLDMSTRTTLALDEQASSARHLHNVISQLAGHVLEIDRSTQEYARGAVALMFEIERVRDVALGVRGSTEQQTDAATAITRGMVAIAHDLNDIRDRLREQLRDAESISSATDAVLDLAQKNEVIASEFDVAVGGLTATGRDFERAVARFRV